MDSFDSMLIMVIFTIIFCMTFILFISIGAVMLRPHSIPFCGASSTQSNSQSSEKQRPEMPYTGKTGVTYTLPQQTRAELDSFHGPLEAREEILKRDLEKRRSAATRPAPHLSVADLITKPKAVYQQPSRSLRSSDPLLEVVSSTSVQSKLFRPR
jgi:hypothetical protein